MKKNISKFLLICCLIITFIFITSCDKKENNNKISIVTTVFSEYDWVLNVLGEEQENAEVTFLLDNGIDLHNYQPTVNDIIKISNCDLLIYVGGESDEWMEDALENAKNKNMIVINLLESLGELAKEEEIVEGMEGEEEEEEEGEEEIEYDEHVWLSLKNAPIFVNEIKDALCKIDESNAEKYKVNAEKYINKLNEMDAKYEEMVRNAKYDTVVFADRFPFRYLVDDYNINYYAAFVGCSAETEASFKTIIFLAEKIDELEIGSVLIIESSDGKIANTVVQNTAKKELQILKMDSLQSSSSKEYKNGRNYLNIMEENLEVLRKALN